MKKSIYYERGSKTIPISIISTILYTIFLLFIIYLTITNNKPINIKDILSTIFFLVIELLLILNLINNINNIRTYKIVLEKGIKIPGTIIRPEKKIISTGIDSYAEEIAYYLIIKYIDPNTKKEVEFKTDRLSINPYKRIKSTNCNIYIYNDIIIAEDFELTNIPNECIFKDIETNYDISKKDKKIVAIVVGVGGLIILTLLLLNIFYI